VQSKVRRDLRRTSSPEIFTTMLVASDGSVDTGVLRAIAELGTVLAPALGRFAAERATRPHLLAMRRIVKRMRRAGDGSAELAGIALEFWEEVVAATGNVAFALAFNSLTVSDGSVLEQVRHLLADEPRAVDDYDCLVDAIAARKGYAAAERATRIFTRATYPDPPCSAR